MDWILYAVIGITIFEIWRNFKDINFSLSDLSPKNFFDGEGIVCLVVLIIAIFVLLFQESVEFRILLVWSIAIFYGIHYFKREQKEIQKKKMGFLSKMLEYLCLLIVSLMVGFVIWLFSLPDMERYNQKQMVKEIHQQQSQPVNTQYQR